MTSWGYWLWVLFCVSLFYISQYSWVVGTKKKMSSMFLENSLSGNREEFDTAFTAVGGDMTHLIKPSCRWLMWNYRLNYLDNSFVRYQSCNTFTGTFKAHFPKVNLKIEQLLTEVECSTVRKKKKETAALLKLKRHDSKRKVIKFVVCSPGRPCYEVQYAGLN